MRENTEKNGHQWPLSGIFSRCRDNALAHWLEQVEREPRLYQERIAWCTRRAPGVHPAREHQAGASLLGEVTS